MKKLSVQVGYQNTKKSGEDLYLTPYLFLVNYTKYKPKVLGLGIGFLCWSFYIAIGYNVPKELRGYNNHKVKNE